MSVKTIINSILLKWAIETLSLPERAKAAEKVAKKAREIAPVKTGEYRDSISVEVSVQEVAVVATAPHAPYVEARSAVLQRAARGVRL